MAQPKIKIGILGYGSSARNFHLHYIKHIPDFEIYAFLQRAEAPLSSSTTTNNSARHCTVDYPNAKHYRTADEFFADPQIEVVVVTTREDTHASFAEMALRSGKHVVVEKPFTRTSEEADAIIKVAKEKNLILTCFQNRRWDGDFKTLQHVIQSDALGTVKEAEIHFDIDFPASDPGWFRKRKYTPGSGMAFGLGSHTIDQALVLFGRPKSVTGFLRSVKNPGSEVDDTFTAILQYDGPQTDLLVTIKSAVVSPMQYQLKYFVRGTKGSFVKHGTDVQEPQTIDGLRSTSAEFGVEPVRLHGLLTTTACFEQSVQTLDEPSQKYIGRYPTVPGRYLGYYENLAAAVRGQQEIAVKADESRDGIRVIELLRLSHERGKTEPWS